MDRFSILQDQNIGTVPLIQSTICITVGKLGRMDVYIALRRYLQNSDMETCCSVTIWKIMGCKCNFNCLPHHSNLLCPDVIRPVTFSALPYTMMHCVAGQDSSLLTYDIM